MNKVTVFVDARGAIHILPTLRMVTACCVFCADKDAIKPIFFPANHRLNGGFNILEYVGLAKKKTFFLKTISRN